jgi:hypothetical protein
MAFQYKVVPFIGRIRGSGTAEEVSKQLQTLIASETRDGWEFSQLGDVNIEVSPGCIAALFGAKVSYVKFDQLIFRRASP